jgi:hypothetical protein
MKKREKEKSRKGQNKKVWMGNETKVIKREYMRRRGQIND